MTEECLYFITDPIGRCKVGRSTNPEGRLKMFQCGNPTSLVMLGCFIIEEQHGGAREVEAQMHRILAPMKVKGEWFMASTEVLDAAMREAIKIASQRFTAEINVLLNNPDGSINEDAARAGYNAYMKLKMRERRNKKTEKP